MARPCARRTAYATVGGVHVVEEDDVGAGGERLVELLERVDLALDLEVWGLARARLIAVATPPHAAM